MARKMNGSPVFEETEKVLSPHALEELRSVGLYPNAANLLATVDAYRSALAGLVRQVERFAEESGEADFFTGAAVELLGSKETWPPAVEFQRRAYAEWEPWHDNMTPKPPSASDAPFFEADTEHAQWPETGVHFVAIRIGGREWRVEDGHGKWK